MILKVGQNIHFQRTFTKEDVRAFTKLSQDEGGHHLKSDKLDRLVVQGLLTATLPTKIGGDYDVLASEMKFNFRRPVFTNQTIYCQVTIENFKKRNQEKFDIAATFICTNPDNKQVLSGYFTGVILNEGN